MVVLAFRRPFCSSTVSRDASGSLRGLGAPEKSEQFAVAATGF